MVGWLVVCLFCLFVVDLFGVKQDGYAEAPTGRVYSLPGSFSSQKGERATAAERRDGSRDSDKGGDSKTLRLGPGENAGIASRKKTPTIVLLLDGFASPDGFRGYA